MQLLTEVSGLLASITGLLLWLPQGLRVWRDRHAPDRLAGISVPTQVLSLAGNVLWLLHAIGIGSFWLGAPSVVTVPIAVMTIVVVRRAAACRDATSVEAALLAATAPDVPLDELPALDAAAVAVTVPVVRAADSEPDADGLVLAS